MEKNESFVWEILEADWKEWFVKFSMPKWLKFNAWEYKITYIWIATTK
jgi:hypothetical protein